MTDDEVRIVDPVSGGEKGSKIQRFDLIPPEFTWALAKLYGEGAKKYAERNWERGYVWGLSLAALHRHLNQWQRGETHDPETGAHHLMSVAWHVATLHHFEMFKKGTDDVHTQNKESG